MEQLKSVEVHDLMMIESLRFETGAVTIISGDNELGKSAILEGIANIFHGGHDSTLIRKGATKAVVTLILDNGTEIKKVTTHKGYDLYAKTAKDVPLRPPKHYVDSLAKGFGFDPIAFMDADKKARIKFLFDVMPIEFTAEELAAIVGDRAPVKPSSLPELEDIRAGVYDARKALNQSVRALEGSIKTMAEGLPAIEEGMDWEAYAQQLTNDLSSQRSELAAGRADLDAQKERLKNEKRAETQGKIDVLKTKLAAEEKRIDDQAEKVYAEGAAEAQQQIDVTTTKLATAQEKATAIERAAGARKLLEKQRDECRKKFLETEEFSRQLKAIEKLKHAKLKHLPVPGLDLIDGEIHVEGIPWNRVCTSSKWLTTIQIAACAAGKLPLIICDRAEHLSGKRWEGFVQAIRQTNLQVITARVTDDVLRVESAEQYMARHDGILPADSAEAPEAA